MIGIQYNFIIVNQAGTAEFVTDSYEEATAAIEGTNLTIIFSQQFVEQVNKYSEELKLYTMVEASKQN